MNAKRPELLIETGKLAGQRYPIGDGGVRLGRSSSNDIKIPDEELSRNHCLLEASGEAGVRLIDLASANGTFVNGEQVGSDPVELKPGDAISLGSTRIRVVAPGESAPQPAAPAAAPSAPVPVPAEVDLGLGGGSRPGAAEAKGASVPAGRAQGPRRKPVIYFLWAFAVGVLALACWLVLQGPESGSAGSPAEQAVQDVVVDNRVVEMSYEKVSANSEGIFRYKMDLSSGGTLKVQVDDVPGANRHIVKSAALGAEALGRIREIFADDGLLALDHEYAGPTEEPPKLESCSIKVVFATRVKSVRVVNTPEPEAFRRLRERLETFSKNELGIWAIQYSADKLVELAEASARNARTKWEDRDVQYGNVHAAIAAWKEAMFYLETVNPKPAAYETYRAAKDEATRELERRFSEQRFRADRAINLADWNTAAAELKILCEMVPDREDERAREAAAKLLDVEKRQKKGGAR